jgi:integrase/recombinase XerD
MNTELTVIGNTAGAELPALIVGAGKKAAWRFLEFFTVNIRNKNTRAAYARAAASFLRWCEGQGIGELGRVQPVHVAAYIELLQGERAAPTVKQHLACIRMLFDWLVIGQVMPSNPAHSVRWRHSVSKVPRRYCPPRKQPRWSPAWMFQQSWVCVIVPSLT